MVAELLAIATAFTTATQNPQHAPRPFEVGELATYSLSGLGVASGTGTMEVVSVDTLRGRPVYRYRFILAGKAEILWKDIYSINDTLTSWADTATLHSLRFYQSGVENKRKHDRRFEMFPERAEYTDGIGRAPKPSVATPLDEIAMLYYLRGEPLEVGKSKLLHTYFRPASNPVILRVLERDTITVAGARRAAIVVQPIIKSRNNLFDEDAGTRVWFSDDSARIILQMKVKVSIGTLTMQLKSYRARLPGAGRQRE